MGSIIIREPPKGVDSPYVIGLVLQYAPGDYIENNCIAQFNVENSKDISYVEGLKCDTRQGRRENVRKCLDNLVE